MAIVKQARELKPHEVIRHPNGTVVEITRVDVLPDKVALDFKKDNLCHADLNEEVEVIGLMMKDAFWEHAMENLIDFDQIPDDGWGYAPTEGARHASITIEAKSATEAYLRALSIEDRFAKAFPWLGFHPILADQVTLGPDEGKWTVDVERW